MKKKPEPHNPNWMKRLHKLSFGAFGAMTLKTETEPPTRERYVYQRVAKHKGNLGNLGKYGYQLRRELPREDRKSPGQLAMRERLAEGTAAWKAMDQEGREGWKAKAEGKRQTGYNLFIGKFMRGEVEMGIMRYGTGTPANSLGADGDLYLDLSGMLVYGPKSGGAWGDPTDLITSGELATALAGYTPGNVDCGEFN